MQSSRTRRATRSHRRIESRSRKRMFAHGLPGRKTSTNHAESFRGDDHLRRILEEAEAMSGRPWGPLRSRVKGGLPANVKEAMIKGSHVGKSTDNPLPADVSGFDLLARLALDMRWSWDHCTDEVWRQLDPVQWSSRIIPGASCRPSRETIWRACSPIPGSAARWPPSCSPGSAPLRSPPGFSGSIPSPA